MFLPPVVLAGHDVHTGAPGTSAAEARVAISLSDLLAIVERLVGQGYEFVSVAEFLARRKDGGVALLTFDDAYRSIKDVAFADLKAAGVPFVIFVVAEALAQKRDPFPLWLFALRDARDSSGPLLRRLEKHPLFERLKGLYGGQALQDLLAASLPSLTETFRRGFTPEDIEAMGEHVAAVAPLLRATLSSEELREMLAAGGVELGAHSMTHRSFALLDREEIEAEIVGSVQAIAAFSDRAAADVPFAYPYGASTTYAQGLVARHCSAGFTCHSRAVSRLDPAASLPRINLDARCSATLGQTLKTGRNLSLLKEKFRLHVRTGPAWGVIGPVYRQLRPRDARGEQHREVVREGPRGTPS